MTTDTTEDLSRNTVTARIRAALRRRSGKRWSVTGGRGTAYGWITIDAAPSRSMTEAERAELATLLALDTVYHQGVSILASSDYYREYIDRAEGRAPRVIGRPYWD